MEILESTNNPGENKAMLIGKIVEINSSSVKGSSYVPIYETRHSINWIDSVCGKFQYGQMALVLEQNSSNEETTVPDTVRILTDDHQTGWISVDYIKSMW